MAIEQNAKKRSVSMSSAEWRKLVFKYQQPRLKAALFQVANTLLPYIGLWYLMYLSLHVSYWLTAGLAILAGGFLIRIFIIFHDCGHSSFFRSQRANQVLGFVTGLLTFTPFGYWRWQHALHHSTAGNLDRRGMGDVWTLTVQEYLEASRWKRLAYRLARNPFVLFVIAPMYLFLIHQRIPVNDAPRRERLSVWWMNLAIVAWVWGMSHVFGFTIFALLQLVVLMIGCSAGVWLFYVQHQFDGVYWERREEWNYYEAALQGSSFYKLPKVLQWFSGNIGYHHVHHLSPLIPNYNLEKCHKSEPMFQKVKPLTLFASMKSLTFRLWDEQQRKLVGYRALHQARLMRQTRGKC